MRVSVLDCTPYNMDSSGLEGLGFFWSCAAERGVGLKFYSFSGVWGYEDPNSYVKDMIGPAH